MRLKRAIIHIGPKKTGTSTIQDGLSRNRAALARRGILYPGTSANHNSILLASLCDDPSQHPRLRIRMEDPELSGISEEAQAKFAAEIAETDWHTLILSAETLYELRRPEIRKLQRWLEPLVDRFDIVATARDPVDWAVSSAQQSFKSRDDLDGLLGEPEVPQWQRRIGHWEHVFGRRAVRMLCFEDLVADPDGFTAAFLKAIHLQRMFDRLDLSVPRANESLSWEAAMMMATLNKRRPYFINEQRNIARSGRELSAFLGVAGQRFDLPDETRRRAYDETRDDVAWLGARFGIDRYDYPPDRLPASRSPAGISPEFMAQLGDRLADMANELLINRNLLIIERLRAKGRIDAAEFIRRKSLAKFPADKRFAAPLEAAPAEVTPPAAPAPVPSLRNGASRPALVRSAT